MLYVNDTSVKNTVEIWCEELAGFRVGACSFASELLNPGAAVGFSSLEQDGNVLLKLVVTSKCDKKSNVLSK